MIDMDKPIAFYDVANKQQLDYRMAEVLYRDNHLCLAVVQPVARPNSELARQVADQSDPLVYKPWRRYSRTTVLFDTRTGDVQNKDMASWSATNDVTVYGNYLDIFSEEELNAPK